MIEVSCPSRVNNLLKIATKNNLWKPHEIKIHIFAKPSINSIKNSVAATKGIPYQLLLYIDERFEQYTVHIDIEYRMTSFAHTDYACCCYKNDMINVDGPRLMLPRSSNYNKKKGLPKCPYHYRCLRQFSKFPPLPYLAWHRNTAHCPPKQLQSQDIKPVPSINGCYRRSKIKCKEEQNRISMFLIVRNFTAAIW